MLGNNLETAFLVTVFGLVTVFVIGVYFIENHYKKADKIKDDLLLKADNELLAEKQEHYKKTVELLELQERIEDMASIIQSLRKKERHHKYLIKKLTKEPNKNGCKPSNLLSVGAKDKGSKNDSRVA